MTENKPQKNVDNKSSSQTSPTSLPKPYTSGLFHPHMTWIDWLFNLLMPFFLNFNVMLPCLPDASSSETIATIDEFKKKIVKGNMPSAIKAMAHNWSNLAKCPIGEYVCTIPVKKDILQNWGIIDGKSAQNNETMTKLLDSIQTKLRDDEVKLVVRFPTSLLPSDTIIGGETNEGFVKVESLDLRSFAMDATMLVQFHGGGYVMGFPEMITLVQEVNDLLRHHYETRQEEQQKDEGSGETSVPVKPLVTVSVGYSLAPKNPFPAGIVDTLSVIDYLLESNPQRKIHLSGNSAGSALAVAAGLEAERTKYPGRVLSVHLHSPFIDPKADSMSYYMNSRVLNTPSPAWLRWCWQAYLGMKSSKGEPTNKNNFGCNSISSNAATKENVGEIPILLPETNKNDGTSDTATVAAETAASGSNMSSLDELLKEGSNATAWEKCIWNIEPFNRLARPIEGISTFPKREVVSPEEPLSSSSSPMFLIVVNKADALYSEGVEFAQELQTYGFTASLFEHTGVHVAGSTFDTKGNKERHLAWAKLLFP